MSPMWSWRSKKMSRSALLKQAQNAARNQAQAQVQAQIQPPYPYPVMAGYAPSPIGGVVPMPGYPMGGGWPAAAVSFPYGMAAPAFPGQIQQQQQQQQQHVPIPLTGDEDEDDAEDPEHRRNTIPMVGNTSNFNMNTMLHNNIMESEYFHALYQIRTYHEVIHEINCSCKHVEPWQTGTSRTPSTAFCLLNKLLLMKLTYKQMSGLLDKKNTPLVRAIGFLYLRYIAYNDLWNWYEGYLEDETEIHPSADQTIAMSIGKFLTKLLTEMNYYGTTLPRIPVLIERKIKVMLLLLEQRKGRRQHNLKCFERGEFRVGVKVKAIYSDEDNEPAWYEAVIDSQDEDDPMKFWVTYPEYGNTALVDLGEMELLQPKEEEEETSRRHRSSRSREREHRSGGGGGDRSRSRSRGKEESGLSSGLGENLLEQVLKSSRDASAAVGKNYAHRPASYKGSLALKVDRHTVRKQSPTRGEDRRDRDRSYREDDRDRSRDRRDHRDDRGGRRHEEEERDYRDRNRHGDRDADRDRRRRDDRTDDVSQQRHRESERAWEGYQRGNSSKNDERELKTKASGGSGGGSSNDKMKSLLERYGDASAN